MIYNVENGAKEKMDNHVQTNMVSLNGIYLAEYSPKGSDKNLICEEFYYVDSLGTKEKIKSSSFGKTIKTDNDTLFAEYFGSRIFYRGFAFDYIRIGPKNGKFWGNKYRRTPEFLIDSLNLKNNNY